MSDFNDAIGIDYLRPSPLYPAQNLVAPGAGAAQPGQGAAPAPDAPPTVSAPLSGGSGMPPWLAGMLPSPQSGIFGPNTGRVLSGLGTGLSSAGQNWNKPALAAFASGAGAALQGGQQYDNQVQSAKLKALQVAIAAFRAGDMAGYHRSLADYHKAVAQQKQQRARPPTPESQVPAASGDDQAQAVAPAAIPLPADATPAVGAAVDPQVMVAHGAALGHFLTNAGVPPNRVEPADLDSAARLMATKALPAAEAFEAASLHNAMHAGHVSPAEIDQIYGPGAADAIRSTAAS